MYFENIWIKKTVQDANRNFPFSLYPNCQAQGGKVIETEYWFRRQMGTICLLGELSIHPTHFIRGIIYSSGTILRDMLTKLGQYMYWGNYLFI